MSRLSFSYSLLASFLLIAAILGATALGGLITLEEFASRHRESVDDALKYSTAVQQLGERSVDMERSARQFLVLKDPLLRERFEQARGESLAALGTISALRAPSVTLLVDEWRMAAEAAGAALTGNGGAEPATAALGRVPPLNERLAGEVRAQLDRQSHVLFAELDANRGRLAWHVLAAIIAACTFAALTGWWLLRPINRLEAAIEALGESRFDEPVAIPGPADLRRVGRRLDWLRLRLADLEANRNRVLRHVSHELKTPLASLREGIALLEDGVVGELSGEQREVVAILQHNTYALQGRIEDLLGYNAAVFHARNLRRRPVLLRALAESVIAEQQLPIQTRNLKVALRGDPPAFSADPDKLRIVLANLLANAVSFSPRDGEIRLTLSNEPGWVRIDCIDQGPGAAAEEAERIFDPFFQGSRQPEEPRHGSGLGLSIVREFIVAHGGRVGLQPSAKGAYFRIELPNEI
ncbi:HAMP domain-containing protein [Aromatoleum toluvorans]|uniref:Signal transduction histidine-protein kinase/phosphatase MprB n=1 Tax=Aromatoleum toluvorans TaxID=92002 RepID=A0ABX1Q0K9_9RHOO|nr:HAMP domain-containing sensor histidine kinase [Aromatoleum toluvorans]NMG44467.1 HAMP domain-containing protein [Aromatoleum toluvorans]